MPGFDDYDELIEDSADTFGAPSPADAAGWPRPPRVELDWAALSDDDADLQMGRLWTWVRDVLLERYEMGGRIPPCWPLHGQAVEGLTALWLRWVEVVKAPPKIDKETGTVEDSDKRGMDALLWHDHLETTTLRISNNFSKCVLEGHSERPTLAHPDAWDGQQARPVRREQAAAEMVPADRKSVV